MGIEYLQSNLSGGELSPALHARTDIDKYGQSVASAENMVIVPQGGLRRRPGLAKQDYGYFSGEIRIEPFVFNQQQKYIVVFRVGYIDVLKENDILEENISVPQLTSIDIIDEINVIQSADTLIITHETFNPIKIYRGATELDWYADNISLEIPNFDFTGLSVSYENNGDAQSINIKTNNIVYNNDGDSTGGETNRFYKSKSDRDAIDLATEDFSVTTNWEDIGYGKEPVWSVSRGYPAVGTFHGGRLWLAGSTDKPTSIWGSRVNGFFDFTYDTVDGSVPDDHGIFDTIDANQYNKITNIFSGRKLQLFTTGSEFINDIDFPTPADSSWKQQTGYGSKRLQPILIDGATLFVDSSERTIRQFIYDFNEDGFVSNNITLLASHLMTNIKAIAAIKGTTLDVSDYVYAINEDGTVAVMNTLRSEGLLGWTHWTTDGEFIDVCVAGKDVYFVVKRNGAYFVEKLAENSYTDHHVILSGVEPTTDDIVDGSDDVVDIADDIVDTDYASGTAVTTIDTDYNDLFLNTKFKVVADYSIFPDATPTSTGTNQNEFSIPRDAYRLEVGLGYDTKITMLPISTNLKNGNTLHRRKRVVKVTLDMMESLGVSVEDIEVQDRQFSVVLDDAPELFTGFKEIYILGYQRTYQFEVSQDQPLPLLIRGIGYEIAY